MSCRCGGRPDIAIAKAQQRNFELKVAVAAIEKSPTAPIAPIAIAPKKGCSKCRFAKRGCSKCVTGFIPLKKGEK